MITVSGVSKAYGGRKLFEDVDVTFARGNRYGLTGPNGAGKSTFMKIIAGDIEPDIGHINRPRKTAVLAQDHSIFNAYKVLDTVIMGNAPLWEAMQERDVIYANADNFTDEMGMRIAELECVVAEEDGYTAEPEAESLLLGLGIGADLHQAHMSELSGGLKVRVLLAQALFGHPEAMMLDEPTNHLDLDTIEWLENFMLSYRGVLVVISHDRRFLNSITTHIADIDYETIIIYPGNYDDMVRTKGQIRHRVEQGAVQKQKKIADLNEFIQRFSAGSRASQVQSRKKHLEKIAAVDVKRSNIARPFIRFDVGDESGRHVVDIVDVEKSFDGRQVISPFRTHVNRGDRIGIIGKDGVGKTTLIKMLLGELASDSGSRDWGPKATIGYLPQEHEDTIETGNTIDNWLHGWKPGADLEEVRGLLGRMLFRGDEGKKDTNVLSGGERVRMLFCKLMITRPNTLVLDEPTNHLDLESISALAEGLAAYQGTMLLVTHDRDLISEACTRIWHVTATGHIVDYRGSWDEYHDRYLAGGAEI
jgi:ATPase subunit of ABC transporter with duplicated ATPase domains